MTTTPATERRPDQSHLNPPLVVSGLGVGAVLGMAGNFVTPGPVQDLLYAVSAAGLVVAGVLLAVGLASNGHQPTAAGFALLALGESRLITSTEAPGADAAFAAGVLLYAPALILIALTPWAASWVRAVGCLASVPFAAHAVLFFAGSDVDSAGPLASTGYVLLTITIVGWVITVLRPRRTTAG